MHIDGKFNSQVWCFLPLYSHAIKLTKGEKSHIHIYFLCVAEFPSAEKHAHTHARRFGTRTTLNFVEKKNGFTCTAKSIWTSLYPVFSSFSLLRGGASYREKLFPKLISVDRIIQYRLISSPPSPQAHTRSFVRVGRAWRPSTDTFSGDSFFVHGLNAADWISVRLCCCCCWCCCRRLERFTSDSASISCHRRWFAVVFLCEEGRRRKRKIRKFGN